MVNQNVLPLNTPISKDLVKAITMIAVMLVLKGAIWFVAINALQVSIYNASELFLTFYPSFRDFEPLFFVSSDPPLEIKDIPTGEWLCHSCKYNKKQSGGLQTRNKRSASTPVGKSVKKIKVCPMELLIEAAQSMNPRQFELPRSMSMPCIFPGTDKSKWFFILQLVGNIGFSWHFF